MNFDDFNYLYKVKSKFYILKMFYLMNFNDFKDDFDDFVQAEIRF